MTRQALTDKELDRIARRLAELLFERLAVASRGVVGPSEVKDGVLYGQRDQRDSGSDRV